MAEIEMICLANSRKLNGRCVAGIRTDGRGWIRPVSARPDGTLDLFPFFPPPSGANVLQVYQAQVLDVLRLQVIRRRPEPHQPENWEIGKRPWELVRRPAGQVALSLLAKHIVTGPELLGNCLDRVEHVSLVLRPASSSLALIKPSDLRWHIGRSYSGKRQTRAMFTLNGAPYDLVVTDPVWESRLSRIGWGIHDGASGGIRSVTRVLLTVSLGEPLEGVCYKLVAGIVELP